MPRSKSRQRRLKTPVRKIDGTCTTTIEDWKDCESRTFIVVKFSMIKTLRDGERGFSLQGNATNLGNWRGMINTFECPPNSGHHVVYVSLPKNCQVQYKWSLIDADGRTVKERELQRSITLEEKDLTVQDVFGVYTSLLPQVFQPDYHPQDQVLTPVAFVTNHEIEKNSEAAVAIIGSTSELGRWRSVNAKMMFEVEPNKWATIVYLTKGLKFRYKFVVIDRTRSKRIKYGERREHRVNLPLPDTGNDDTGAAEQPEINGVWTATTDSNISIKYVEEQSMGSVVSDVSLGTRASLGTILSDINEEAAGLEEPSGGDFQVLATQTSILDELKEALHGTIDLMNFNPKELELQPLLAEETVPVTETPQADIADQKEAVNAEICLASTPPTQSEDNQSRCAEWIQHSSDSKPDEELVKLNENEVNTENISVSDSLVLDTNILDNEDPTLKSSEGSGPKLSENETKIKNKPLIDISATIIETKVGVDEQNAKYDGDTEAKLSENEPIIESISLIDNSIANAESNVSNEQILKPDAEHEANDSDNELTTENMLLTDNSIAGTEIIASENEPISNEEQEVKLGENELKSENTSTSLNGNLIVDTGNKRSNDERTDENKNGETSLSRSADQLSSCTSLKTSTAQLPSYFACEQTPFDVARKLAVKLPWILDLPAGLVTRVLHSLGIMSKEKQTAIAEQLRKPRSELLKEENDEPIRNRRLSSLPTTFVFGEKK